jgi:CcmD family protein
MAMFLLQEGPAQTINYMFAGYGVIFGAIALYIVSLFVRQRNVKQELEMLEEMENK